MTQTALSQSLLSWGSEVIQELHNHVAQCVTDSLSDSAKKDFEALSGDLDGLWTSRLDLLRSNPGTDCHVSLN